MMTLPTLGVVYGLGAASPTEIVHAARDLASIVFLMDSRAGHGEHVKVLLGEFAPTVDLAAEGASLPALDAITTFAESAIGLTSVLAQQLALPYHDHAVATRLTDKAAQRRALNAAGVSVTRLAVAPTSDDLVSAAMGVGYPLVVKPRLGEGGRFTAACKSADDLRTLMAVIRERGHTEAHGWVVEELLASGSHPAAGWLGDYVSVESAIDARGIWNFAVTDKLPLVPPFREQGNVMPSRLPEPLHTEVTELASAAIEALGIRIGVVHTEIKLTPTGPRIIEINGRLGGVVGQLLQRTTGIDPIRLVLEIALGRPVERTEVKASETSMYYSVLPPSRRVRVSSVAGAKAFLELEGVWKVDTFVRPGAILDWRGGVLQRLYWVWASTADPSAVPAIIAQIREQVAQSVQYQDLENSS